MLQRRRKLLTDRSMRSIVVMISCRSVLINSPHMSAAAAAIGCTFGGGDRGGTIGLLFKEEENPAVSEVRFEPGAVPQL